MLPTGILKCFTESMSKNELSEKGLAQNILLNIAGKALVILEWHTLSSTNVDTRASSLSKSRFAASKANSRFRSRASSSSKRSLMVDMGNLLRGIDKKAVRR